MTNYKNQILTKICYTDLVYARINKKLLLTLSNKEIEKLILENIVATEEINFQKIGKNIYITNESRTIKITVNSSTNRIITVDQLKDHHQKS